MTTPTATDQRITELEIKVSFMEDLVDKLDAVIIRQQRQIDALLHELIQLRDRADNRDNPTPRNLRDELPPHY